MSILQILNILHTLSARNRGPRRRIGKPRQKLNKRPHEERVFGQLDVDEREDVGEERELLRPDQPVQNRRHEALLERVLAVDDVFDQKVQRRARERQRAEDRPQRVLVRPRDQLLDVAKEVLDERFLRGVELGGRAFCYLFQDRRHKS